MADAALLDDLRQIAVAAGRLALSFHGRPVESWDKGRDDPVSAADIAVDDLLRRELSALRPDAAILSEESGRSGEAGSGETWIVDPIDGTRAFLKGRGDFAVSVALLREGVPVIGSLYAPTDDRLYTAVRGEGAERNGRPIKVSKRRFLENARMVASSGLFRPSLGWKQPWPEMRLSSINSFALRIAAVADDSADAVVTLRPKSDWDIAAAHLILSEAGGEIVSTGLEPPGYGGGAHAHGPVIAANPELMASLTERLRESGYGTAPEG